MRTAHLLPCSTPGRDRPDGLALPSPILARFCRSRQNILFAASNLPHAVSLFYCHLGLQSMEYLKVFLTTVLPTWELLIGYAVGCYRGDEAACLGLL
jgi:hypothetical protein